MVTSIRWRICKNRLVLASLAGTLVWFADQPTVTGYNPLLEMFWDPGIWRTPAHDRLVLLLSCVEAGFLGAVFFTMTFVLTLGAEPDPSLRIPLATIPTPPG